jgi:hypothetical protein
MPETRGQIFPIFALIVAIQTGIKLRHANRLSQSIKSPY